MSLPPGVKVDRSVLRDSLDTVFHVTMRFTKASNDFCSDGFVIVIFYWQRHGVTHGCARPTEAYSLSCLGGQQSCGFGIFTIALTVHFLFQLFAEYGQCDGFPSGQVR